MASFIAFVTANSAVIFGVLFAVISLLTAIFNKNEKATGILGVVRTILERISGLQPANSAGTLKVPGRKPNPPAGPTPGI